MVSSSIFYIDLQSFLGRTVIDQPYVYIDYWSAIHFSSGLILGFIFAKYLPGRFSWLIAACLLVAYEIFEVLLDNILFFPETLTDKAWDLIIGMAGFFIAQLIYGIFKK